MSEETARAAVQFLEPESWVRDIALEPLPDDLKSTARQGVFFRQVESQVRLAPGRRVWFQRVVKKVTDSSGLESAANFTLDFDPAHEGLIIHHFRIRRGDELIDVDTQKRMHLVRRERGFEASRLDGQWTWAISVPDLRVGDEVDVASSWVGSPPVLGDDFSNSIDMQWQQYCLTKYVRILSPTPLIWKAYPQGASEPVQSHGEDGYTEWLWHDRDIKPWIAEPQVPEWVRSWRGFFVTNLHNWGQVATRFLPGYADEPLPEALRLITDDIAREHTTSAERIVAALRYVQTNIRYFSVQMGAGGYVPRPLERIVDDRMGDCKDVSKLLVAMLRHLEIEACPALVHTEFGTALDQMPAGINGFNHCIVRVRHEGRSLWLDATRYPQGGDIDHLVQASFGFALPVQKDSELEPMLPQPVCLVYEVNENFSIKRLSRKNPKPSILNIATTFRGQRADLTRFNLQSDGIEAFSQTYIDYYKRLYGEGVRTEPLEIVDDIKRNEIVIHERIEVDNPWSKTSRGGIVEFVSPEVLFGSFWGEASSGRKWPFDAGYLRQVRVESRVSLPFSIDYAPARLNWENDGLRWRAVTVTTNQTVHLTREYETKRQYLTAEERAQAEAVMADMYASERVSIQVREKDLNDTIWTSRFMMRYGWIIAILVIALLKWLSMSGFLG